MTSPDVKFVLPGNLSDKVAVFPEYSYGVSRVTLILKNGKRIPHVYVAWAREVIKAAEPADELELSKLDPHEVSDVISEP